MQPLHHAARHRIIGALAREAREHLDRADLTAALWNLRELSAEWLMVSVSTRPSSCYNLYHATIIPKRSSRTAFAPTGPSLPPGGTLAVANQYVRPPPIGK